MNSVLVRAVVEALAFLELSSDEAIDPDAAVKAMEEISYRLQALSKRDKATFCKMVRALADDLTREGDSQERIDFVRSIPFGSGLEDEGR
jgi:hypothetical protein